MSRLTWNGDAVRQRALDAAKRAVDATMADCVIQAKRNHPGFNNITGTAEGSIQVVKFAEQQGNRVRGLWGSRACGYFIWLEVKRGAPLRSAAAVIYPRLAARLKEFFKQ